MDRRVALKNMGLALGYTVATPTLISLMQSCRQETTPDWIPVFFSPEEGMVLSGLADLILPKTDTPSASEVGVPQFIDQYMNEVSEIQEQEFMKMGLSRFIEKALADSGKAAAADLTPEDLEPVLAAGLKKREKEEEKQLFDTLMTYNKAVAEGRTAELDEEVSRTAFATQYRDAVIWAYKNTEQVGEQVLAYLSIPGQYIGCGDLDELTGGKAWSL
ncbi:gluconate 2-dehydrogenase subunit 3 family protein [Robiginitalea marina]|uniref:Gluconate 2-dehydrogenase subunit 3 family protein n=1 Tax=Robiginitalea marina TaxID=2954105 RepID=A0ABT1AWB9_9FLAO|nr:gluconate 2-dehydrogenase subunit 3 family protein [Robiginitalea marina]MCO5724353.1 gluconate 2-dehydrogenase subunit 3 family protein [Robiginitalea marina]